MRILTAVSVVVALLTLLPATAGAVCIGGPGPVIQPDPEPPPPPPPTPPLQPETPEIDPGGVPTTPRDPLTPGTPPPGPLTPGAAPEGPLTPGSRPGDLRTPGVPRPRPRGVFGFAGSWLVWWEINREYYIGLRKTLPGREVSSGGSDPMPEYRREVRAALRDVVRKAKDDGLRARALCALGRAGNGRDARLFLEILLARREPGEVREAAAIGLASLPSIEDPRYRAEVRRVYGALLMKGIETGPRIRQVAILALAMRSREDAAIVRALGMRLTKKIDTANEAAAILLACGLSRDEMLAPLVIAAAESGRVAGQKLDDVARAHAALALPLCAGADAVPVLNALLGDPKTGVHTRRCAARALGKSLRETDLPPPVLESARARLLKTFDRDRDVLVKAYAAIAMGGAKEPFGVAVLSRKVERGSCAVVRPFAALALALAAGRLDADRAAEIRALLVKELGETNDLDLSAALCIAVGLSGAEDGRKLLLERAGPKRKNPEVRAPACQALGLLGPHPATEEFLRATLDDPSDAVVEKAAIGLGLIGGRESARAIVSKLVNAKSERVQGHLVIALSHLGGTPAIGPLVEVLADPAQKTRIRESAAAALGVLVDPRDIDPLFEFDALVDPYALTAATRALFLVY